MNEAIKWFTDRQGKVTYSMTNRNGPSSYDCSSAVYYSLIQGGLMPQGTRIGNTDRLFNDLENNGWTKVPEINGVINAQRGDVFIWGKRGSSGGAFGHTGIFLNSDDIIHCSYGYNGIHTDNHDWLYAINGYPDNTIYRYTGAATPPPPTNSIDQIIEVGSYIKFKNNYRADDVQLISGIWQVRNTALCRNGFTWAENGIPTEPLVEVTIDGYLTDDQELDIGSWFVIHGKFVVLDVGFVDGMWLARIEWNGLSFWVDIETATEIDPTDPGTPIPTARPVVTEVPTAPVTPTEPEIPTEPVDSVDPIEPEAPIDEPVVINKPEEEQSMAYTKEDQKELLIAVEPIKELVKDIHNSQEVIEITNSISKKTKIIVYIVCDVLIGLGLVVPGLAVAFNFGSLVQVTALSGVLATAGGFGLTMFGIYKGKN